MRSSSCNCRGKLQAAAMLQTLLADLRISIKSMMTIATTIIPLPALRILRSEIRSSRLGLRSGRTRPRHLFDGESVALVTNAISYALNATGRTRAPIASVLSPKSHPKFVPAGRAILTEANRVRVDLRIRARTEEAWKGFKKGPRRSGRGCHDSWTAEWQFSQGRRSNDRRTHFPR